MQNEPSGPQVVRFGTFELDVRAGELRKQGVKIRLQEQPLRILQMLLAHPGQLVTREELRSKLWPSNSFVDFEHGLNKAIAKLREALGDSADSPRFVETLARRGYRFIEALKGDSGRIRSLLVLPLENLSRDPEQEYFADGLTEALITNLARISSLRVVSRTTAVCYRGANKPLPEIARELSVDGIVEGTVLRSGERVRISAQLLHGPTDTHLWAESYDRDLRDVMALQSEVAHAIARQVEAKVTPREEAQLANTRQVDPEVLEDYLRGRYFWNKRTMEGMSKGAEYFQRAVDKDPDFAAAYAGLADSATRLGWWGYVKPEDGCGRAKAAALKALAIDNNLADAYAALAFAILHYDYAFAAAEEASLRAIELDPRSSIAAQVYGCVLMTMVRTEEGVFQALRAVQLDPLSLALQWTAGIWLFIARQYDRAIAQSRRCLELDPSFPPARSTIALALATTRRDDFGIADMEEVVQVVGTSQYMLGVLGYCYGVAGRRADALRVLDQFHEAAKQRYISPFWPAAIHGALGEMDEAFRLLEAGRQERAAWMPWVKVVPWFDFLRSDPRFDDLVRRIGIPAS